MLPHALSLGRHLSLRPDRTDILNLSNDKHTKNINVNLNNDCNLRLLCYVELMTDFCFHWAAQWSVN